MDFKAEIILLLFLFPILMISSCQNNAISGCTMEAKVCPDGSTVGRLGPDCEFEQCPTLIERGPGKWGCPKDYACYTPGYCYTGDICSRCESGKCGIGESLPLAIICE